MLSWLKSNSMFRLLPNCDCRSTSSFSEFRNRKSFPLTFRRFRLVPNPILFRLRLHHLHTHLVHHEKHLGTRNRKLRQTRLPQLVAPVQLATLPPFTSASATPPPSQLGTKLPPEPLSSPPRSSRFPHWPTLSPGCCSPRTTALKKSTRERSRLTSFSCSYSISICS